MSAPPPPVWTDKRIREAFIYDGGESEYHDPINGARTQREVAGAIFDAWLAAHDAALLATVPTPPAGDMHANNVSELLGEARELVASWDLRGSWTSESPIGLVARLAGALEVAVVRPHVTVTDAEVDAADAAWWSTPDGDSRGAMRNALEAAREVHP